MRSRAVSIETLSATRSPDVSIRRAAFASAVSLEPTTKMGDLFKKVKSSRSEKYASMLDIPGCETEPSTVLITRIVDKSQTNSAPERT